jgi:hypothetical protein
MMRRTIVRGLCLGVTAAFAASMFCMAVVAGSKFGVVGTTAGTSASIWKNAPCFGSYNSFGLISLENVL